MKNGGCDPKEKIRFKPYGLVRTIYFELPGQLKVHRISHQDEKCRVANKLDAIAMDWGGIQENPVNKFLPGPAGRAHHTMLVKLPKTRTP